MFGLGIGFISYNSSCHVPIVHQDIQSVLASIFTLHMYVSTYKSASDISKLRLLASPLVLASDMLTLSLSVFSSLFS